MKSKIFNFCEKKQLLSHLIGIVNFYTIVYFTGNTEFITSIPEIILGLIVCSIVNTWIDKVVN
jgi:hypothetical protein